MAKQYSLVLCGLHDMTQEILRFLVFDGLVVDDENVMSKTLEKRYGVRLFTHD